MIIAGLLLVDPQRRPAPGWLRLDGERIAEIGEGAPPERPAAGGDDAIVCSGFIDAHMHVPQIDAIGCDGLELLAWLERIIFPAELRWADVEYARAQLASARRRLLQAGTLGYAGYLTAHAHALDSAVEAAGRPALRAVVGQVLMDRAAPDGLLGHPPAPLRASADGRFASSVNPRFAVACSDALLARAAERAAGNVVIQTHLAESVAECRRVAALFPHDEHYTAVYDRHGLLTPRTLLAHGVHLGPAEWSLIASRRSVVVHCPSANVFLRSGLFDLTAARDHAVRLALGSDVAAGPDLAMPRVARAMIEVAKCRALQASGPRAVPTPAEAWTMITRGNADALGWSDAGRLEVGAAADLLVLEPPLPRDDHLIGRLLYTWRNDYITTRVVAGRLC